MWLVDTNVLSELRRPKPEQTVVAFITRCSLAQLYVSVVTVAEIRYGIESVSDPAKRAALGSWLTHTVRPMFEARILPVTEDIMLKWRLMVDEGGRTGHTFSQPDLLIAATAACHNLTIITRNSIDYEKSGVALINPWEER
jgi:toxin FitB